MRINRSAERIHRDQVWKVIAMVGLWLSFAFVVMLTGGQLFHAAVDWCRAILSIAILQLKGLS